MDKKIFKVAIIGVGSRGGESYGLLLNKDKRFKISSLCDIRKIRLEQYKKIFNVPDNEVFLDEEDFFKKKRGDILIIATQDRNHVRHALKALKLGYDILLEKPITPIKSEAIKLLEASKKYHQKVLVCHVLRYAPTYVKVKQLLDDKVIGDLVNIEALEQVAYWHQAHSFVRGNWRSSKETSPMILAKCCHDLDLLQYYANSKCKTVSSFGELSFFNKEHQPKGASNSCSSCKYLKTCPYSAYRVYVERWKEAKKPKSMWPQNVVCPSIDLNEQAIIKAYNKSNYGSCVFKCDNDVVDHQVASMVFNNGVTATLTMTAFTSHGGRIYRFHGTYGDIVLDEDNAILSIRRFGEKDKNIPFSSLLDINGGHGGGDAHLINDLYNMVLGKCQIKTALEASIESHLMAYAIEESRQANGKNILVHKS